MAKIHGSADNSTVISSMTINWQKSVDLRTISLPVKWVQKSAKNRLRPFQIDSMFLVRWRVGFWPFCQNKKMKNCLVSRKMTILFEVSCLSNVIIEDCECKQYAKNFNNFHPWLSMPFLSNHTTLRVSLFYTPNMPFCTYRQCYYCFFLRVCFFLPGGRVGFRSTKRTRNIESSWNGLICLTNCTFKGQAHYPNLCKWYTHWPYPLFWISGLLVASIFNLGFGWWNSTQCSKCRTFCCSCC